MCASYELEFKLSKKINTKIIMEGKMLMTMFIANLKMVAEGICRACP